MEIADFAEITQNVIKGAPFEDYIPTLCLPARSQIKALQGVPAEEEQNIRAIVLDWANDSAEPDEEFLVAFRDGPSHFRIIRRFEGEFREALFPAKKAEPVGMRRRETSERERGCRRHAL